MTASFTFAGVDFVADPSGMLYCHEHGLAIVADLHLEKGSAFAASGAALLPPYDTRATLAALTARLRFYRPCAVVCLGDSFHDDDAAGRLSAGDAARLRRLVQAYEWTWVTGNHDPDIPADVGGRVVNTLTLGPLVLRHAALLGPDNPLPVGEVSGHYHPKARVQLRGRRVSGRCFVTDGQRLILPSFGAYTGGLDVLEPVMASVLRPTFRVFVLGRRRVFAFGSGQLVAPPPRAVA